MVESDLTTRPVYVVDEINYGLELSRSMKAPPSPPNILKPDPLAWTPTFPSTKSAEERYPAVRTLLD